MGADRSRRPWAAALVVLAALLVAPTQPVPSTERAVPTRLAAATQRSVPTQPPLLTRSAALPHARQAASVRPGALSLPSVADEGLSTTATSRYVLDERRTTVEGSVTIELRNVAPDDGDIYYYFDAFAVPVPAGARSVRATSGGSSLDVSLRRTEDPSTRLARISFPDLRYGRSRTMELTFEVPGAKPRSDDSTRVGPGYATFAVYGVGDAGRSTVEVVAPSSMRFDSTSDAFTSAEEGSTTTHSATATDDEGGFWAVVSLRDPAKVEERAVDVSGTSLLLSGYPDDTRWVDFVGDRVVKGIPALERLVGTPWPGGLERIREDASPSLRGYDGWFDPSDDEIVIGEALDEDLLFHELSHAWVSGVTFDERWVSEGLAQVLAERTVALTGGTPREQPDVSRRASGAVALNDWGGSAGSRSVDVDAYAYPASYAASRALLGDLDDVELAAVVGAGIRGERAYDPPGTADADGGRTSWQRWLDLLQTRAEVEAAPEVFARWALTEEERALLAPRDKARKAYAQVDEADGPWLPPEGLRDAMTAWDFERAAAVRGKVAGLADAARRVQDAARRAGLPAPDVLRTSWEKAEQDEQYAALATSLPAAAATVTAVARARAVAAQDRDPVSELGATVLGVDDRAESALALLEDGRFDAASEAAAEATSRAERAALVGFGLPAALLLVLVAGLLVVRRVAARRRRASTSEAPTTGGDGEASTWAAAVARGDASTSSTSSTAGARGDAWTSSSGPPRFSALAALASLDGKADRGDGTDGADGSAVPTPSAPSGPGGDPGDGERGHR